MAAGDGTSPAEVVARVFHRLGARDLDGVMDTFADGAVFIDPHYPPPIGPDVRGKDAIRRALEWAFGAVEQFGFEIRHVFDGGDQPTIGAVEVDTRHRLTGGMVVEFPQVFVVEVDGSGRVLRLQSYCPYPPPGPPPPVD